MARADATIDRSLLESTFVSAIVSTSSFAALLDQVAQSQGTLSTGSRRKALDIRSRIRRRPRS